MATTYYKHITQVLPSELILKKDGTILLNLKGEKKQVIGTWSVEYPKKEAKAKGWLQREFVDRYYDGGIPYKGQAGGYTREEFKRCVCNIISRKGIDIETNSL